MRNVYLALRIVAVIGALYFMGMRVARAETFTFTGSPNNQWKAYSNPDAPQGCNVANPGQCTGPHHDSGSAYSYYFVDHGGGSYDVFRYPTDGACPDDGDPQNFDGTCGTPPRTAEECAADTNVIIMPITNPPPAVCQGGCSYAAETPDNGNGLYCDVLGENCEYHYSTAAAAANHAAAPTDPRFNATCTDGQNPGQTEGDEDGDTVPDNEDPDTADRDADGVPDGKDSMPDDPENGKDTDGDESDNVSSGGGNCQSPPVSSGDGIASQIAFQTWATRCAVENQTKALTGKPGAPGGGGMVVKLDPGTATQAGIDASPGLPADGPSSASLGHGGEDEFGAEGLDVTGMGASQSCPVLPTVDVLGQSLTIDTSVFCDWMQLAGLLVLAFGSLAALKIISGAT